MEVNPRDGAENSTSSVCCDAEQKKIEGLIKIAEKTWDDADWCGEEFERIMTANEALDDDYEPSGEDDKRPSDVAVETLAE